MEISTTLNMTNHCKTGKKPIHSFRKLFLLCCSTVFLLFLYTDLKAQHSILKQKAVLDTCYASTEVYHTQVFPEALSIRKQAAGELLAEAMAPPVKTATFEVTYIGFTPEAQAAFQYAVDIWSTIVKSEVPIKLLAIFTPLPPGVLGAAGPNFIWANFSDDAQPDTWYVDALADAIAGEDLNADEPGEPDIVAQFSSTFNWYYGTDLNPAPDQFDFASVVLHEMGHGLGFTGGAAVDENGVGFIRIQDFPLVYNDFVVNGDETPILSFEDPSEALGDQLTSEDLFMAGENAVKAFAKTVAPLASLKAEAAMLALPELYAPSEWSQGSSYSHWDEEAFPAGEVNSLMTPFLGFAEAIHNVGPITKGLFADMGWEINDQPVTLITLRQTVQESGGADCSTLDVPETDRIIVLSNTEVCYYYTVKNVGDITLNLHDLMDDRNGVILDDFEYELTPGASVTVSQSDTIEKMSVTNVATWTAFNPGPESEVMATGVVNVDVFIPPLASARPEALLEKLPVGGESKQKIHLKNDGEGELEYKIIIRELEAPFGELVKSSGIAVKEALKSTKIPDQRNFSSIKIRTPEIGEESTKVILGGGENLKIVEYATDFEDFELGDLFGQDGWFNTPGYIISLNPFSDNKFLQAVSSGAGDTTLAFSPNVGLGNEPFSSFATTVNVVGQGTTFEIIPQSPEVGSVVTRIRFAPDGFIYLLVPGGFANTGIPVPTGSFDLQMVVDRTALTYSFYIDGELIFPGLPAFAGDIEEVALLSFNEAEGSIMNIDNFIILDGDLAAPDWVTVDPSAATVDPLSSLPIDVLFNAEGLEQGTYFAVIFILTNDPFNPVIDIPVALVVTGEVRALYLIDAKTDEIIRPLERGDIINLAVNKLPLNIQAVTNPEEVGSVVFKLNGKVHRIENEAPYALNGDLDGDFLPWYPKPGNYKLEATPYSMPGGKGVSGEPLMVQFKIITRQVKDLNLVSVCSDDPDLERRWQIINPNGFDVEVTWQVVGTDQISSLTASPGMSYFTTTTVEGPNTTIIRWENENSQVRQKVKASNGEKCNEGGTIVARIHAYPNPTTDLLNVQVEGETGEHFTVAVVDQQSGKTYFQNQYLLKDATTVFQLNTLGLPTGNHILMVASGRRSGTIRFVKR